MDSFTDVKEALVARSTVASIDDLKSQGRSKVKVIKAEHIAAMVREAVENAVAGTGMISREEVDMLVERSREEFRDIVAEREQQLTRLRDAVTQLEEIKVERVRLQASLQDVLAERNSLRDELEHSATRIAELEEQLANQTAPAPAPVAAAPSSDMDPSLVMKLMTEVAELKANMSAGTPQPQQAGPGADEGITAAIDKLAGTLNDRLEKFGRKMGISSAVEGQQVNFDALFEKEFDQDSSQKLESNMDSVQAKKKQEGGISANLERLRKLKGGG